MKEEEREKNDITHVSTAPKQAGSASEIQAREWGEEGHPSSIGPVPSFLLACVLFSMLVERELEEPRLGVAQVAQVGAPLAFERL